MQAKLASKVSETAAADATELQVVDTSIFSPGDTVTVCPGCDYGAEETNQVVDVVPQLIAPEARGADAATSTAGPRQTARAAAGAMQPGILRLAKPLARQHRPDELVVNESAPSQGLCGDAGADGITASDALRTLRAAVGLDPCDDCICDADGSGWVTATDALVVLKKVVGLPIALLCPVCL